MRLAAGRLLCRVWEQHLLTLLLHSKQQQQVASSLGIKAAAASWPRLLQDLSRSSSSRMVVLASTRWNSLQHCCLLL
jgi:hypothetical protein